MIPWVYRQYLDESDVFSRLRFIVFVFKFIEPTKLWLSYSRQNSLWRHQPNFMLGVVYSLCFIHGQILLQCLSRTQNLAAHVMLLKKGCYITSFLSLLKRDDMIFSFSCDLFVMHQGPLSKFKSSQQRANRK